MAFQAFLFFELLLSDHSDVVFSHFLPHRRELFRDVPLGELVDFSFGFALLFGLFEVGCVVFDALGRVILLKRRAFFFESLVDGLLTGCVFFFEFLGLDFVRWFFVEVSFEVLLFPGLALLSVRLPLFLVFLAELLLLFRFFVSISSTQKILSSFLILLLNIFDLISVPLVPECFIVQVLIPGFLLFEKRLVAVGLAFALVDEGLVCGFVSDCVD